MTAKTAKALHEMMTVASRELLGYEGPITVTLCPDREKEPLWCGNCGDCWMCRDDDDEYPWCGPFDTDSDDPDVNSAPPRDEFFYAQHSF